MIKNRVSVEQKKEAWRELVYAKSCDSIRRAYYERGMFDSAKAFGIKADQAYRDYYKALRGNQELDMHLRVCYRRVKNLMVGLE